MDNIIGFIDKQVGMEDFVFAIKSLFNGDDVDVKDFANIIRMDNVRPAKDNCSLYLNLGTEVTGLPGKKGTLLFWSKAAPASAMTQIVGEFGGYICDDGDEGKWKRVKKAPVLDWQNHYQSLDELFNQQRITALNKEKRALMERLDEIDSELLQRI